jgi:SagB-type dehydrogenase family enzyme
MKALPRSKYLRALSYELDDVSLMEEFHEATKFFPDSTLPASLPRVVSYLTDPRAILETARNRKLYRYAEKITLPTPAAAALSLEDCLARRRSVRYFGKKTLSLQTLSAMLFDAIAPTKEATISGGQGLRLMMRPYASGGGLYPIEVYPILLNVADRPVQVTHYDPFNHQLSVIGEPPRADVLKAIGDVEDRLDAASVIFVLTSVTERTAVKYSMRGYRFALLEAGQIAQNLSLCAVSRGLGSLPWGGYIDDDVGRLLDIDNVGEIVVHLLSVGEVAV